MSLPALTFVNSGRFKSDNHIQVHICTADRVVFAGASESGAADPKNFDKNTYRRGVVHFLFFFVSSDGGAGVP